MNFYIMQDENINCFFKEFVQQRSTDLYVKTYKWWGSEILPKRSTLKIAVKYLKIITSIIEKLN